VLFSGFGKVARSRSGESRRTGSFKSRAQVARGARTLPRCCVWFKDLLGGSLRVPCGPQGGDSSGPDKLQGVILDGEPSMHTLWCRAPPSTNGKSAYAEIAEDEGSYSTL
jgi:hypothetical protein